MSLLFHSLVVGILLSLSLCHASPARKTRAVTAVSAVSSADQTVILDEHNKHRNAASPTAMNMRKMHWNASLANVAQQWTDQCKGGHDNSYQRRKDGDIGVHVGQNAALRGDVNWNAVVQLWHSEKTNFVFGSGPITPGAPYEHYTQVVWGESSLIGCGQTQCGNDVRFACNYAYGNLNITYPYEKGTSCASCAGKCEDKLCECPNGMICKNGGILDLTTCSCTCQFGWSGTYCDTCPEFDSNSYCGKDNYAVGNCGVFANLPYECPVLCSFCEDKCNGLKVDSCLNGGTLVNDASGCGCQCTADYGGDTCQTRNNCQGFDPNALCGTGGWKFENCKLWSNLRTACPVLCGECPDQCNGLTVHSCLNEGTLVNDASGCHCECTSDYDGDTCQTRTNCADADNCQLYGKAKCTGEFEGYIKNRCPTMCGVCSS